MYSIGQISKIVKISVDALRYYDEIGLLKPHYIEKKNRYRYYSEEQVNDILFITELKQYGFSLDAIKELLHCKDMSRLRDAYDTRLHQLSKELISIENSIKILKKRMREIEKSSEHNMNNKRILIVDDVEFMRNILKDILKNNGFTIVGQAINGYEGVEKYFELKPDIVIMNIEMPELDGINAVKIIREKDDKAKIVMCSAKGDPAAVLQSIHAGASDFVVKPFYADYLKEVMNKTVDEVCAYNVNAIADILKDKKLMEQSSKEPGTQKSINKLLNMCKEDSLCKSDEIEELLNFIKFEEK